MKKYIHKHEEESVLVREVSLFQGLKKVHKHGTWEEESVLF